MSISGHSRKFRNDGEFVTKPGETVFTRLKTDGWAWSFLSTILADYPPYIIGWKPP